MSESTCSAISRAHDEPLAGTGPKDGLVYLLVSFDGEWPSEGLFASALPDVVKDAVERWAGAVDSVGSTTLANVLAQTIQSGAVAACGLAGGADLPATVMPHILRGVALLGINSVTAPHSERDRAWAILAESLNRERLAAMTSIEPLSNLPQLAQDIVAGKIRGRVVIDVAK